jgi:hypothetical protein
MTIINEPRYQDFNGRIHKTEKQCIDAEQDFREEVYQIFKKLVKGCNNQSDCNKCPFHYDGQVICLFERITHNFPTNWKLEEEE